MNFEFKMASLGNVLFIDRRIMDVAFLISLKHKHFFISPPPPHSCLFLVLWFVFFRQLIALTFAGNTCLMKVSVCICIGFSEFNPFAPGDFAEKCVLKLVELSGFQVTVVL